MSSRAASLGLALDATPAAIEAEPAARKVPVLGIAIALVAVAAIAGGGWFMLSPRGTEQAAITSARDVYLRELGRLEGPRARIRRPEGYGDERDDEQDRDRDG